MRDDIRQLVRAKLVIGGLACVVGAPIALVLWLCNDASKWKYPLLICSFAVASGIYFVWKGMRRPAP
jgi:hypothetical protein